ncbi:MAG: hypothetical protein K0R58_240 [Ramlibacter sp.]|nr:hypothetical protein [Ramlibacter sp.]
MAASKHLGIRDAVAALLAALAGGRVRENDPKPLAGDLDNEISVRRDRSTPTQATTGFPIDWVTELSIEMKARTEADADDLACSVFAAVMANQQLGGLSEYIEPGEMEWDQAQGEKPLHRVTWRINVTHTTQNNVIT